MKPEQVKQILMSKIAEVARQPTAFVFNPNKDFIRQRKLTLDKTIKSIIGMGGGSLSKELMYCFDYDSDMPTTSAFVQQRQKIKVSAFENIFDSFTTEASKEWNATKMRVFAVDGSDIQIATNPKDKDSYFPGKCGQKSYNLLHLNALYDLEHHIYVDACVQKRNNWNEHSALVNMVDNSEIADALIIADRGYESYNNMAHIQEKGWKFLIRIRENYNGIKKSLCLPQEDTYDLSIDLALTRKQTNETKRLFQRKNEYRLITSNMVFDYLPVKNKKSDETKFYNLKFRIVRFKITEDTYETVVTNLDKDMYPAEKLKTLYAFRWGIETSFRDLKYTIGLMNLHSKKVMCIQQEIYARLIMYNFTEMITSHVIIKKKQRKYTYKANFSIAAHMCRTFFCEKTTSPDVETIVARNIVPIRPDRCRPRKPTNRTTISFLYRIA